VPILLFWDRAPWHHGEAIRALLAAHPRLEIIEYPVAAPHLNPQQQDWKQSRPAVSHNHVCPTLPQLALDFEQHWHANTLHTSFLHDYAFDLVCPFLN